MIKTAVVVVLGAAAAAAAWWFLAPPALGGSTSLAIVDGSSMFPTFERNDLVVLRPSSAYRVGDVVAYHSTLVHRVVLHRIVAVRDGRYTFKGDNNNFLDPEQPADERRQRRRDVGTPRGDWIRPLRHVGREEL